MAESEEAEVDYYAVLNVSKEVKIVFQEGTGKSMMADSRKKISL